MFNSTDQKILKFYMQYELELITKLENFHDKLDYINTKLSERSTNFLREQIDNFQNIEVIRIYFNHFKKLKFER